MSCRHRRARDSEPSDAGPDRISSSSFKQAAADEWDGREADGSYLEGLCYCYLICYTARLQRERCQTRASARSSFSSLVILFFIFFYGRRALM